jgi:hypothetical protein
MTRQFLSIIVLAAARIRDGFFLSHCAIARAARRNSLLPLVIESDILIRFSPSNLAILQFLLLHEVDELSKGC